MEKGIKTILVSNPIMQRLRKLKPSNQLLFIEDVETSMRNRLDVLERIERTERIEAKEKA